MANTYDQLEAQRNLLEGENLNLRIRFEQVTSELEQAHKQIADLQAWKEDAIYMALKFDDLYSLFDQSNWEIGSSKLDNAVLAIKSIQAENAALHEQVVGEPPTADDFNMEFRHNPNDDMPHVFCDGCDKSTPNDEITLVKDSHHLIAKCNDCANEEDLIATDDLPF